MKNALPIPSTTCETASSRTVACFVSRSTPITICETNLPKSAAIITLRRLTRSATTPPISITDTCAAVRAASTIPRSVAEPMTSTANASATETTPSPRVEATVAPNTKRRSRRRSTSNRFAARDSAARLSRRATGLSLPTAGGGCTDATRTRTGRRSAPKAWLADGAR